MTLRLLYLAGLALNVIGTGIVFVFAYPPKDDERQTAHVALTRVAVLLVFFGFLLQFAAAIGEMAYAG